MVVELLRRETAELHTALEAALPLGPVPMTREQYADVLLGFYSFFATWESEAARLAPSVLRPLLRERARLPLVAADLAALGLTPERSALVPSALPDLASEASLLGSMYVLEGSRLGGQLIARQAERSLGLTPVTGSAFFHGFGRETSAHWKSFCLVLERSIPFAELDRAVAAARRTFLAFQHHMAPIGERLILCPSLK